MGREWKGRDRRREGEGRGGEECPQLGSLDPPLEEGKGQRGELGLGYPGTSLFLL